ncbi:hypothetical protein TNCV_1192151 [Trichonephila clavipes]|nr:hypothetical protein TNCV_1192151 [Trichonephila clavipes]
MSRCFSQVICLTRNHQCLAPKQAFVDGITRRSLFNAWNEEQDPKRKIDAVLSLVRSTTDFDKYENQQQLKFRKIVKNFCSFAGKKWMRCHRNEKFFSKSNDAWLLGDKAACTPSHDKNESSFSVDQQRITEMHLSRVETPGYDPSRSSVARSVPRFFTSTIPGEIYANYACNDPVVVHLF